MSDSFKVYASKEYVDSKISELGGSAQPDWNQNDPTAADYVKGRTHYDARTEQPAVKASEFSFAGEEYGTWVGKVCHVSSFPVNLDEIPHEQDEEALKQVARKIVFDGNEYICDLQYAYVGHDMFYYGNYYLCTGDADANTGEPFFWGYFCRSNVYDEPDDILIAVDGESGVVHTISAYSMTETELSGEFKKLDPKYLPDGVPYSEVTNEIIVEGLVEPTGEFNGLTESDTMPEQPPLSSFPDYENGVRVVWDGVEYLAPLVGTDGSGSSWAAMFGNPTMFGNGADNGVPFMFCICAAPLPNIQVFYADTNTHTMAIVKRVETVHTIDPKYLPAGLATETYVDAKVSDLVNTAPEALDTLKELSAALGDDPNFATTVLTQLGNKADAASLEGLATETYVDQQISQLSEEIAAQKVQKVTLPQANGTPNHGTAGQFAVSDGMGGIMWKTLVEAEEVAY